jgi:outer membrane protein TolC
VAAADAAVASAVAALRPRVAASAGVELSRPNTRYVPITDQFEDSWQVGVGVSWEVFDRGGRRAEVAAARAEAEAARHDLESVERAVRVQVEQAWHRLAAAEASVPVAQRAEESAAENLRVVSDRYREGLVPSSELLDAEVALRDAGLERTRAVAATRLAQVGLERAMGR